MLEERIRLLREAGAVLRDVFLPSSDFFFFGKMLTSPGQEFDGSVVNLIEEANQSAAGLVNLLASCFPCFKDEVKFERKNTRILKRAQILVADVWAAFDGKGLGEFNDIEKISVFAGKCQLGMLSILCLAEHI